MSSYIDFLTTTGGARLDFDSAFNLVGDAEWRVDITPTTWTPSTFKIIASRYNSAAGRSWELRLLPNGNLVLAVGSATGAARFASELSWTPPAGRMQLRFRLTANNTGDTTVEFASRVSGGIETDTGWVVEDTNTHPGVQTWKTTDIGVYLHRQTGGGGGFIGAVHEIVHWGDLTQTNKIFHLDFTNPFNRVTNTIWDDLARTGDWQILGVENIDWVLVLDLPEVKDHGVRYVAEYGNNTWSGVDWSAPMRTISAAADSLNRWGLIRVGEGDYTETSQIRLRQGMVLEGNSPVSTRVKLANNANHSLIVSDPLLPSNEFLHWAGVKNMRLDGNKTNNTVGHAVEFNCRIGESTRLENLLIIDTPNDGIRGNRGGQPLYWNDLHIFRANGYGVSLRRTPGDRYQSVLINMLSGDENRDGLLHVKGAAETAQESITVVGLKPETGLNGQTDAVVLEDTTVMVTLIGGSTIEAGGVNGNALVKIVGTAVGSRVLIQGFGTNHDYWIQDLVAGVNVPAGGVAAFLYYQDGEVKFRLGD